MKKISTITAALSGVITTGVLLGAAEVSIVVSVLAGVATAGTTLLALPSSGSRTDSVSGNKSLRKIKKMETDDEWAELKQLAVLSSQVVDAAVREQLGVIVSLVSRIKDRISEIGEVGRSERSIVNVYLPSLLKVVELYQKVKLQDGGAEETVDKYIAILDKTEAAFKSQLLKLNESDRIELNVEMAALEQIFYMDGLLERSTHKE